MPTPRLDIVIREAKTIVKVIENFRPYSQDLGDILPSIEAALVVCNIAIDELNRLNNLKPYQEDKNYDLSA